MPDQRAVTWRRTRRAMAQVPGARLAQVPFRVAQAAAAARARPEPEFHGADDGTGPALTPGRFAAAVALDELVLGLTSGAGRLPPRHEIERVASELERLDLALDEADHFRDPVGYHREPPAADPLVQRRRLPAGINYDHLRWRSSFAPDPELPGAARWGSYVNNATGHAYVLEHAEPERPWVVCIHGLGTGFPAADFVAFHVTELYRSGVNVALPALPRHGPRKHTRRVDEFLSHDLVDAFHGLTQAVADVRALLGWIQARGGRDIALHGISLGGYVAAVTASVSPRVDMAVVGVPLTDLPALFAQHSPPTLREEAVQTGMLGSRTDRIFGLVSPLHLPPRPDRANLAVYGGQADRMSTLAQARRLWEHWRRPSACWYAGNHVGVAFNREARGFVEERIAGWRTAAVAPAAGPEGP